MHYWNITTSLMKTCAPNCRSSASGLLLRKTRTNNHWEKGKILFMANESAAIVQRLWNYCNVLRDDGVGYGDYVEQLTYLLFLKMSDEQTKPPFNKPSTVPEDHDWRSLLDLDGDDLEIQYRHTLENLAKHPGMLGTIFRKSQNKIQDPAKLKRLIELIN